MKLGINRKVVEFEIGDQTFKIGIVPVYAHYLVVKHDNNEGNIEDQVAITYEIVESILLANGYEFDKSFWERNLDYVGFVEFIANCLAKDAVKDKKKAQNTGA